MAVLNDGTIAAIAGVVSGVELIVWAAFAVVEDVQRCHVDPARE